MASVFKRMKRKVAEKLSGNSKLVYSPLQEGQFRLAKLQPSSSGYVRVELCTVHLTQPPPFEVLSYIWGQPSNDEPIVCNGSKILVRPNLSAALRTLCRSAEPRLLWIDYICINRSDNQERDLQVQLLASITLAAEHTIVWVGDKGEDTAFNKVETAATAFKVVSELVAAREKAFQGNIVPLSRAIISNSVQKYRQLLSPIEGSDWRVLEALLSQPMFQRVWTVPDFVLSDRLTLFWGTSQLQWSDLIYGLEAYSMYSYPNMIKHPRAQTFLWMENARQRRISGQEVTFEHLIDIFSPLKATHPHDNVYAMYSILRPLGPPQDFVVDYANTSPDAFTYAARLMVSATPGAPYLSLSMAGNVRLRDKMRRGTNSWVPDFDKSEESSIYRLNTSQNYFTASGDLKELPEFLSENSPSLRFRGTIVDSIYQVACYMPARRFCDRLDVGSANSFFFSEWYEWALSNRLAKYKGDEEKLLLDWIETIQAKGSDNWRACLWKDTTELINMAKAWLEYLETEHCEETEEIRQFHALSLPACGRKLAVTKRGHFCLVPRLTDPSDVVCIPQGSKVPFVFRGDRVEPLETVVGDARWNGINIGECYVHGAMHGEALAWKDIQERIITLD